jgi:hypothetical protein
LLAYFSNLFFKFLDVDMTNFSCEIGEENRREGRLLFYLYCMFDAREANEK